MTPSRSVSVAVAQTCPARGDVQTNLEEHVRLAGIAASSGAQLVVFPELSLTGYELDLARDLAFSEDDPRLCPLLEASSSSSVTLVVGAPVRIGQQMHIGAFIIRPDQPTAIYTKRRLGAFPPSASCDGIVPPAEATVFLPGDRDPLIHVGGCIASVAICADIGQPSHPERAARRGATIYLASMFVIPSEFDGEVARLEGYSATHSMVVALANYGSPSGGLRSAGRSAVWSASGELLAQLPSSGSGVAVVAAGLMAAATGAPRRDEGGRHLPLWKDGIEVCQSSAIVPSIHRRNGPAMPGRSSICSPTGTL